MKVILFLHYRRTIVWPDTTVITYYLLSASGFQRNEHIDKGLIHEIHAYS